MKKEIKICVPEKEAIKYFLIHNYNDNMFNSDGSVNYNYNSKKKTGVIAKIFEDYWDKIDDETKYLINKLRPNAEKEVNKIIDCANKNLGCNAYECPECGEIYFIGNTCKSRLCTSCGYKYKNERVENILQHAINCKHRQIVFTIPQELRTYFFDFKNMHFLFEAVNLTLNSILHEKYKKKKDGSKITYFINNFFMFGFFCFLHTFGRNMKWNPHIHVLIAEKILTKQGITKNYNYFDFDALSKRFQRNLLDLMKNILPAKVIADSYKNHKKGFYVYAESKKFKDIKSAVEYVTRYCGRPVISENRIINYDGNNVTFCYNAHENGEYHEVTVSAIDFIKMILRHLLPYEFKSIRYYGFYNKKIFIHDTIKMLIKKEAHKFRKELLKHELSILKSFHWSPYDCPKCKKRLTFLCGIS